MRSSACRIGKHGSENLGGVPGASLLERELGLHDRGVGDDRHDWHGSLLSARTRSFRVSAAQGGEEHH
jgi:hypothetical protein